VWDRFLSEQDRATIAGRVERRRGFGERPALLFIDLYRWVFGDQPQPVLEAMKEWPGSCGLAAWEAIPHLQKLLAAARSAGIPIIHTTGVNDSVISPWAGGAHGSRRLDGVAAERYAHRNDIIDEVAPLPGELVIHKESPSAFWGSPLLGYLVSKGVDTLLVGGESTSGCVRASVVDGCTDRFRMMVVEECVFDRHEATHAIDLFTMNRKYADVVSIDETLSYLDQWQENHPRS
jgi:nicotinamidase-related amidase